jgi:nucleotide-binding universal stress UspA family protein
LIIATQQRLGADLVVMATHGQRGLKHLVLGSVAERVVRESAVPVLTI